MKNMRKKILAVLMAGGIFTLGGGFAGCSDNSNSGKENSSKPATTENINLEETIYNKDTIELPETTLSNTNDSLMLPNDRFEYAGTDGLIHPRLPFGKWFRIVSDTQLEICRVQWEIRTLETDSFGVVKVWETVLVEETPDTYSYKIKDDEIMITDGDSEWFYSFEKKSDRSYFVDGQQYTLVKE